ncbi:MAG: hypothetical protein JKY65_16795 [Planctomycetes bacterium]|nr:hypothetical protein [Planctomycetota bacterium]
MKEAVEGLGLDEELGRVTPMTPSSEVNRWTQDWKARQERRYRRIQETLVGLQGETVGLASTLRNWTPRVIHPELADEKFKLAYRAKNGEEFEQWFCRLMSLAYPDDFEPVSAWGKHGDWGCDGRRRKAGVVYQCYAPPSNRERAWRSKIEDDLGQAVSKWSTESWSMTKWVFVHNSKDGLGPTLAARMDELALENPEVELRPWAFEQLFTEFKKLNDEQKQRVLEG